MTRMTRRIPAGLRDLKSNIILLAILRFFVDGHLGDILDIVSPHFRKRIRHLLEVINHGLSLLPVDLKKLKVPIGMELRASYPLTIKYAGSVGKKTIDYSFMEVNKKMKGNKTHIELSKL